MKYHKGVYKALAMITQFGINMLVPICVCTFVGIMLDKKLGTSFLVVLFFFIGALAGGRNIYVFAKRIYQEKPERDVRKRKQRSGQQSGADPVSKTDKETAHEEPVQNQ